MTAAAPDRFETVAYVYSPSDLALLLSVLEREDIFVLAIGRLHVAANPGLATALGGVALRVHAEEADDARTVLARQPMPGRLPVFSAKWPVELLLLLMLFFIGVPPPPRMMPCVVGAAADRRLN